MWMRLSPALIGAAVGLVVGLLFVLAGWRIALILLAFVLAGLLVGWIYERRDAWRRKIRDWSDQLPRS